VSPVADTQHRKPKVHFSVDIGGFGAARQVREFRPQSVENVNSDFSAQKCIEEWREARIEPSFSEEILIRNRTGVGARCECTGGLSCVSIYMRARVVCARRRLQRRPHTAVVRAVHEHMVMTHPNAQRTALASSPQAHPPC
jgi:hypothetical protein